jgi:hypothetical protein
MAEPVVPLRFATGPATPRGGPVTSFTHTAQEDISISLNPRTFLFHCDTQATRCQAPLEMSPRSGRLFGGDDRACRRRLHRGACSCKCLCNAMIMLTRTEKGPAAEAAGPSRYGQTARRRPIPRSAGRNTSH